MWTVESYLDEYARRDANNQLDAIARREPEPSVVQAAWLVYRGEPTETQVIFGTSHPAVSYLASLAPVGRRTIASRLRIAARLLGASIDALPWHRLRHSHLELLKYRLSDDKMSPATINLTLSAVRGVLRHAFLCGLMSAEDYGRLQAVKPVKGTRLPAGRALSGGEIGALMGACTDTPLGHRDAATLALLFAAGLRRGEAVALDLEHYQDGELRVIGKGDRERLLYLDNGGREALEDWLRIRGAEPGPLLARVRGKQIHIQRITAQSVYMRLRALVKAAGITGMSPHDLRRTFVSELLDRGADISTVQRLAGHQNIETTARYDRRGEAAKRKAVGLLHLPYRG